MLPLKFYINLTNLCKLVNYFLPKFIHLDFIVIIKILIKMKSAHDNKKDRRTYAEKK